MWTDRAWFCTKTGELSTGHQVALVTGSQLLWQVVSFDVAIDTWGLYPPLQSTSPHHFEGPSHVQCGLPGPCAGSCPLPATSCQGWESWAQEVFPAVLPPQLWFHLFPHSFTHPHALEIIPSYCLVGVAPQGRHGPFWTAPSDPDWQNLGRSLVLSSCFTPCHYLFLFCIKRFFFLRLISYFKQSVLSVFWLPELLQEHCINSGGNTTNTSLIL